MFSAFEKKNHTQAQTFAEKKGRKKKGKKRKNF
jgi:hypothetical protein